MEASPPPLRGGLFGWVQRKPKLAFSVTAVVALLVGVGIGAAGGTDQAALDEAVADAGKASGQLAKVTEERDSLRATWRPRPNAPTPRRPRLRN